MGVRSLPAARPQGSDDAASHSARYWRARKRQVPAPVPAKAVCRPPVVPAPVPAVPDLGDGKRHRWGDVVHDNTVTWLAKWMDSINGAAVAAASACAVRERCVVTPLPRLQATLST